MENLLLLITGILAGLTSIPLTCLAVHSHRELRYLRRSHHALHELVTEAAQPTGEMSIHVIPASEHAWKDGATSAGSRPRPK